MLIRCEKCSTLYELDEKLLPPQGAPVQCSKCQFVFKAYPTGGTPPPGGPERAAAEQAASEPPPRREAPPNLVRERPVPGVRTPLPSADGERQFTADGRPIRKVPFPSASSSDPTASGARPVLITSSGRGSGASPGALRLLLVVVVIAIVAAAALVGWRLLGHRADRPRPAGQGALEPAQRPDQTALGTAASPPRK